MDDLRQNERRWPWLELCALAALCQVMIAGYRYGMANQSIQITFLKHLVDPSLFRGDLLLETLAHYPSRFFVWLSRLVPDAAAVEPLYFVLHVWSTIGVLLGACLLAVGLTGRRGAGIWVLILLAAGHHAGVAESSLYTMEFTHTRAGLALGLLALASYTLDRRVLAFVLLGILFHVHALMASYLAVMVVAWLVMEARAIGWRRVGLCAAVLAALALPMAARIALGHDGFDAEWLRLLRIRSSHHVFLSSWWRPGDSDIPRFLLLAGFGILAFSRATFREGGRRRAVTMALVIAGLCVVGIVFTEWIPVASVMRAQLFRSTRFLVLLFLVCVAAWIDSEAGAARGARWWIGIDSLSGVLAAGLAVCCLSVRGLEGTWGPVLAACALIELARGRLAGWAALAIGAVAFGCTAAWRSIGFPLVAVPHAAMLPAAKLTLLAAAAGTGLLLVYGCLRIRNGWMFGAVRFAAVFVFGLLCLHAWPQDGATGDDWTAIQRTTRLHTPPDAVVLVPGTPGGFRIHSDRAVVGEWRDGTQQFFSSRYAGDWWERMEAIRPGMLYDETGSRMLSRGGDLGDLPDAELETVCRRYGATHIVDRSKRIRDFEPVATNRTWTLYAARRCPPPPPPDDVLDPGAWALQEAFMQGVVTPNIEKHRKSDVAIRFVDSAGRPLKGTTYEIRQVSSRFLFGSALPDFVRPPSTVKNPHSPGVVDPRELDRFCEIFNFSIIGYAGKWRSIEAVEGEPWYENLDRYVEWCAKNGITIEYHFVSGFPPKWLGEKTSKEREALFLAHAERLIDRYGDRIALWQVVNERKNIHESPGVFRMFRERLPKAHLGISDCSRFYTTQTDFQLRENELCKGLSEIRWLKSQDVKLDFFGYHGHRPFGLWADVETMYEALDQFAMQGVRVHISEFGVHCPYKMMGPVRRGDWTPELQAEYYRRYFSVCFSHPAVDAVNLWGMGPKTWMKGAGLLDEEFEPKPAFHALKKLIHEEWRTRLDGTLGLDGSLAFRGFHGGYEMRLKPGGTGEWVTVRFNVEPGATNGYTVTWDAAAGEVRMGAAE